MATSIIRPVTVTGANVSTSAISGAANVNEALSLINGKIVGVEMQDANNAIATGNYVLANAENSPFLYALLAVQSYNNVYIRQTAYNLNVPHEIKYRLSTNGTSFSAWLSIEAGDIQASSGTLNTTNCETGGSCSILKQGRIVMLDIVFIPKSGKIANGNVIFSGLPIPYRAILVWYHYLRDLLEHEMKSLKPCQYGFLLQPVLPEML